MNEKLNKAAKSLKKTIETEDTEIDTLSHFLDSVLTRANAFTEEPLKIEGVTDYIHACSESLKEVLLPDLDIQADFDFLFLEDENGEYKKYGSIDEYIAEKEAQKKLEKAAVDLASLFPKADFLNTDGVEIGSTFEYDPGSLTPFTPDHPTTQAIDSHYSFVYTIRDEDLQEGSIRIDPYFVCDLWNINKRDTTGCLFHMLKTICRLGTKQGNTVQREVNSLYATLNRLCELNNLDKPV